jgi:hypothetical protein
MFKSLAVIPAVGILALAACQPEPTPEQKAAAAFQQAAKEMAGAMGLDPNAIPQIDPNALAAAMAQAGAMNPEMTPEDRAALNAAMGSLQGAPAHPAAAAYAAGLDKTFTVLATVKDDASLEAARPKLAVIYAEMAAPAAALKAMSENEREVAFGSAWAQMAGFGLKAAGLMMPLTAKPELAEKLSDLMDQMPQPQ